MLKKRFISIFLIVFYVLSLLLLSITLEAKLLDVFIGLFPTLIYCIVYIALSENKIDTKIPIISISFLLPIILLLIFLSGQFEYLSDMDIPVIAIMQLSILLIISIIIIIIEMLPQILEKLKIRRKQVLEHKQTLHYIKRLKELKKELEKTKNMEDSHKEKLKEYSHKLKELKKSKEKSKEEKEEKLKQYTTELQQLHRQIKDKEKLKEKNEEHKNKIKILKEELVKTRQELVTASNVSKTLRSIEDKCKAINFVIGRVYSDKKGGDANLRAKLHIPASLYNSFSKISANFESTEKSEIKQVVNDLYAHLKRLEKKEKDVITPNKALLEITKDKNGEDKIIDILSNNDNDPVEDYFLEAKEIITRLMDFLKKEN